MGFKQYHEPADELPSKTRTFARIIVSLTEEAEGLTGTSSAWRSKKIRAPMPLWGQYFSRRYKPAR